MKQPESQHKTHQPESSPRPQHTHTHSQGHAHCHAPSLTLRTPFAPLGAQTPPPNNPKSPKSPKSPKIPKAEAARRRPVGGG